MAAKDRLIIIYLQYVKETLKMINSHTEDKPNEPLPSSITERCIASQDILDFCLSNPQDAIQQILAVQQAPSIPSAGNVQIPTPLDSPRTQQNIQLLKIVRELLTSEQSYVSFLQILNRVKSTIFPIYFSIFFLITKLINKELFDEMHRTFSEIVSIDHITLQRNIEMPRKFIGCIQ